MRRGGDRRAARRRVATTAALAALAGAGHVLYPLWLAVAGRRERHPPPPAPDAWPALTAVVPAYREDAVIEDKVDDLLANGYPGPLSVVVVADDEDTARAAARTAAEVVAPGQRLGKAAALNRGVAQARSPVVVVTDANTLLRPGALAALARWFEDPSVGAVAGEKTVAGTGGEGVCWRFESWLKRRESRQGCTVALVGELAAVRRSLYRPLPPDLAVDDLWLALDVVAHGARVVYEPEAVAVEEPNADWRDDWQRRTRILSGTLDVLWRRRALLVPGRSPVALQLWGHKVLRSSVGPLAHLALIARAARRGHRSRLAAAFLAGHAAAAASLLRLVRGARLSLPERLLAQVLFLQAVALGGLARYVRGDRPALWPKPARLGRFRGGSTQAVS